MRLLLLRRPTRLCLLLRSAQFQRLDFGCRIVSGAAHNIFQLLFLEQIENLFGLAKTVGLTSSSASVR